uniref:Heat shock protein 90, beta (grp94), member 1 n=1 Tax=Cyprinus carpio TaxID=7962 RepID=A0A8C2HTE9_CYPCA
MRRLWIIGLLCALLAFASVKADDDVDIDSTVEEDLGKSRDGSRTDDEVVQREEEAIQLDGLNASQIKEIREKAEKHAFQAEVNRMMKLIINSLYKNKEIFLRELISNASDALDKIRLLSLTHDDALAGNEELTIKIKSDKEKNMLHITDTGIGMTKEELVKNLGTIAKSGTSEFLSKMTEMQDEGQSTSELIGQFGVGFYSAFLVADKVIVTSKHNNGTQHIWESDSNEFSVIEDPRGDTLGRGTTITLVMKEEASDYLELETIKNLVRKYSQFINFPIYVWSSKTETVEEPIEEEDAEAEKEEATEDEAEVEEEDEDKDKPKTKKAESSPFVERLLKKGYEVVYLTEPVDEYCIQALPEFDGKRFQNVAKEGVKFDESDKAKEKRETLEKDFEPLTTWMKEKALKDNIEKAVLSQRLTKSPCALVASQYGWSGNMERIMKAQAYQTGKDISTNYYASQKKTLEINPKHPLIKEMLRRVKEDAEDQTAADLAVVLFETATLRSGYQLTDTKAYGDRIERMLRLSMNVDLEEQVHTRSSAEEEPEEQTEEAEDEEEVQADEDAEEETVSVETVTYSPSSCFKPMFLS